MVFRLTADQFLTLGLETIVGFDHSRTCRNTILRRWHVHYGASPETCSSLFYDLQTTNVVDARVENPDGFHFLIAIYWLRGNEEEEKLAGRFKLDEKTVRKWKWYYCDRIAAMREEKIIFPQYGIHDEIYIISVDGTHCRISEPSTNPSSDWFSHKFSGPGVSYEVAVALWSNQIVWLAGPVTPNTHDVTSYRRPGGLRDYMEQHQPGKLGLGDEAYKSEQNTIATRNELDDADTKRFKGRGKARGETLFTRLKSFDVLAERFRHTGDHRLEKHRLAMTAVCVLVQYEIEGGHPLFDT